MRIVIAGEDSRVDHCLVLYRFTEEGQPSYFEQFKESDLSEVRTAVEGVSNSLIDSLTRNRINISALYLVEGKYEIAVLIEVPDADAGASVSSELVEKLSFTLGAKNVTPAELLPCWLVGHA